MLNDGARIRALSRCFWICRGHSELAKGFSRTTHVLIRVVALVLVIGGCRGDHSNSMYTEIDVTTADRSTVIGGQNDAKRWTTDGILPRVVHRVYFDASGVVDVTREPDRLGFVRPLGNDLFVFLAHANDVVIRNIHQEHLDELGVTREQADNIALDNLRKIAFDGSTIKQLITETENDNDWAIWSGNEFTSSCVLLPELYSWCEENLHAESFLVRVASTHLILIIQSEDRDAIRQFDEYVEKVLEESRTLISDDWFMLTEKGMTPYRE